MVTGSLSAIESSRRRSEYHKKKSRERYEKHKEKLIKEESDRKKYILDRIEKYTKDCRDKPLCKLLKKFIEEIRESEQKRSEL